jgi:hypothetical protein
MTEHRPEPGHGEFGLQQDIVRAVEGAMWQDSLLQSYRQLQLGLQAILLAVLATLAILQAQVQQPIPAFLCWLLLTSVFVFSLNAGLVGQRIVLDKQSDVSDWESLIKELEQKLPEDRRYYKRHKDARYERRRQATGKGARRLKVRDYLDTQLLRHIRFTAWAAFGLGTVFAGSRLVDSVMSLVHL